MADQETHKVIVAPSPEPLSDDVPWKSTGSTIPDPQSVEDHGRTFQGYREEKYFLPNDAEEQDRLDFTHAAWELLLDGRLHLSPLHEPKDVLDIGTGTGIWAIEFARKNRTCNVIGTDLSLIQPVNAPPNCSFIREDTEDEWVFDHPFDFIHLRLMLTCFTNHKDVMQKIFDNLRPGGWVEYHEALMEIVAADEATDEALNRDPRSVREWMKRVAQGMKALAGRDIDVAKQYKRWMREVGFVDVTERQILSPVNPWPVDPRDHEMGKYSVQLTTEAAKATVKILRGMGMSEEETNNFLAGVYKSIADTSLHIYCPMYFVYGRKPGEAEVEN